MTNHDQSGKAYIEQLRRGGTRILEVHDRNQVLLDDDHLVAAADGIEYVLPKPEKHGENPVFRPQSDWEGTLGYVAAMYDPEEELFKTWYQSRCEDGIPRSCYAVSTDGVHWDKPELGLHEFAGSRANNICYVSPGPPAQRAAAKHVFKDYAEPDPERRYKMVLDLVDFRGRGMGLIHSPDGLRWSTPQYTVLQGGFDTQNVVLWDDQQGCFRAYLRWWMYGLRHVRMATSADLYHWSEPRWVLGPDEEDPPRFDLYTPGAVKYAGAPDLYIMLPAVFDHTSDKLWGQLALSRNGVDWHRYREPYLPLGPGDAWDRGSIYPAPMAAPVGDLIYLLYRGDSVGHATSRLGPSVGLATMRRDGFVALRAGSGGGAVTTHPLAYNHGGGVFPGRGRLRLNLRADRGAARVEFLDLDGQPIPGYSYEECDPICVDATAHVVTWRGSPVLDALMGRALLLRIHLRDAEAYSFRFDRRGDSADPVEPQLMEWETRVKAVPPGPEREQEMELMAKFVASLRGPLGTPGHRAP